MSPEELNKENSELRMQLLKLRFQATTGQLESAPKMKAIRRDIARVETVLREMKGKQ
jgi:large subunit ribosomal protein L29